MNSRPPASHTFYTNRGKAIHILLQDSYVMWVSWSLNRGGYPVGRIGGKTYYLHDLVAEAMRLPSNLLVDHIDGNKLNNRRDNLRSATRSQSNLNRGPFRNARSRYIGARPHNGYWKAFLGNLCLGSYLREEDAALARDYAALRVYGDRVRLNFPDRFRNDT